MIAPLLAVALQIQRLGNAPIATAADLEHAHVQVDADHVALGTLLEKLGTALGVKVVVRRGDAAEFAESVIADDVQVGPLLWMLARREPVELDLGSGSAVITAEYFPPVQIAGAADAAGERCSLRRLQEQSVLQEVGGWFRQAPAPPPADIDRTRVSIDLVGCPVQRLATKLHDVFGIRVVVAPAVGGLRITSRAADASTSLFFESLRRSARVQIDQTVAGIATLALTTAPSRDCLECNPGSLMPRADVILAPDEATAIALEPVLLRHLSEFGTIERQGRELHVIDDGDVVWHLRNLTDAWVNHGWRP